jgi:hypothetical protein
MNRRVTAGLLVFGSLFFSSALLRAEVKTQEKSRLKMEGMMGRMMGMFAGKAAKEGIINTVAVKGNRKVTASEDTSEIIDLGEQKIYELDLKKKTYKVTTFEEMRQQLREAQEKGMKAAREEKKDEKQQPEKQMEIDFSLKETGQKKNINGYDCREVLMTITTHEKGKTLEEAGGMVMTAHVWLAPNIPATREITEFEMRYAKAMDLGPGTAGSAEQMAMMMAMYPGMKEMMGKMQGESVNMDGTQILTEMTIEAVQNPAQASQEQEQKQKQEGDSSSITSVKNIGGMLGRFGRKKETEPKPEGEAAKPKNRATLMTTTHELLKVETAVPDSDLAIPAGFKEKK